MVCTEEIHPPFALPLETIYRAVIFIIIHSLKNLSIPKMNFQMIELTKDYRLKNHAIE